MRGAFRTLAAAVALIALAGCGDEEGPPPASDPTSTATTTTTASAPAPELPEVDCPPTPADCQSAAGTIVFVERVDPDGDGDAHFVLAGGSVTAPGVSVVGVRADLRPTPLPGPGDLLAAAGPVFEGSFGQRQIEADEIAFERVP